MKPLSSRKGPWDFLLLVILFVPGLLLAADLSHQAKESLVREATALSESGHFSEARAKWTELLNGGPSRTEARRWRPELGRTYEAEGNFQKALAVYQEAYDADPKNVDRLVDLARLYDVVDMDDQAIRYYAEAHERDRTRRDVTFALARLYKQFGRLAEAKDLAVIAVHAEPRDYSGQELLAEIEEAQGALADAARRRETVLGMHPTAAGYMMLGRLWAKQGAFEQADVAFSRATAAGETGFEPLFERAVLAWRQGDPARATRFIESMGPGSSDYFPAAVLKILMALDAHDAPLARKQLALLRPTDPGTEKWKTFLEAATATPAVGGKP